MTSTGEKAQSKTRIFINFISFLHDMQKQPAGHMRNTSGNPTLEEAKALIDEIKGQLAGDNYSPSQQKEIIDQFSQVQSTLADFYGRKNPLRSDSPSYQTYRKSLDQARKDMTSAKNVANFVLSGTSQSVRRMEGKGTGPDGNQMGRALQYLEQARQEIERATKNPIYKKIEQQ